MDAIEGLAYKPKMPRGMKDMRKHGVKRTIMDHLHDGTHKIAHEYIKPGVAETTHSASDLEGLQDHLQEMLGGKPTAQEMASK